MSSRTEEMLTAIAEGSAIDTECICRREQYLRAIANGDATSCPNPRCREEELLLAIAEKGTGGGTTIVTEDITITPTTSVQTKTRSSGKYINKVTVDAVTSSIDSNITADNIKKDVTILGVTGTMEQGEDLTTELEAQDTAITDLEAAVDNLPETKVDMLQARVDGVNSASYLLYCYSGTNVDFIKNLDLSNVISLFSAFERCKMTAMPQIDTSNITSMIKAFKDCENLLTLPALKTSNVTSMNEMCYGCEKLVTITSLDMINVTNCLNMLTNCKALTNLTLKNIKVSLQISDGTSYGHLLTTDSLINTIKELWDLSGGTSQTLTMGTSNIEKLASTYVKLITPTEEQIAADENIASKMPCEVCESTDEGAMLITDYVVSKNWTLA